MLAIIFTFPLYSITLYGAISNQQNEKISTKIMSRYQHEKVVNR